MIMAQFDKPGSDLSMIMAQICDKPGSGVSMIMAQYVTSLAVV